MRWIDTRAPRRNVVAAALVLVVAGALLYAAHVTLGVGGPRHEDFWNHWFDEGVIATCALLCAWRAWAIAADRWAWAAISVALGLYFFGDV